MSGSTGGLYHIGSFGGPDEGRFDNLVWHAGWMEERMGKKKGRKVSSSNEGRNRSELFFALNASNCHLSRGEVESVKARML
jgi:hypothetical protein